MKNVLSTVMLTAAVLGICSCANNSQSMEIGETATRMQTFVTDISLYARGFNHDFIIIPQNGAELAYINGEPGEGILMPYIHTIDGIGIEELFYDGSLTVDYYELALLRNLKDLTTIIVSEYVSNHGNFSDAIQRNRNEGFIPFVRSRNNYHYKEIPALTEENTNDIITLTDAKNFLYLINNENYATKQAMIAAIAATNYDVVLIDLFFEAEMFTQKEIQQLKRKANGGIRLVISYISIGSVENYRYYWQRGWKRGNPSWLKRPYAGYPDEFWVEFWHSEWQNIIFGNNDSYIKKIIDAGFDGVFLDNVEAYYILAQ